MNFIDRGGFPVKKEKIAWIDHMKLFASIMIMTAHFQDAALDACLAPPAQSGLYDILNTILVPFQTGKCWVIVFCLLSGYLSCRKVSSLRELAAEGFARWLRFFLPLLLCNAWVFLLLKTGHMYHAVYGSRFQNNWLLYHYARDFRFSDVLVQSAVLGDAFNGPLWMLRPLFVGNLLILGASWLSGKVPEGKRLWVEIAGFLLLLLGGLRVTTLLYAAAAYAGLLIFRTRKNLLSPKWIPVFCALVCAVFYMAEVGSRRGMDFSWVHSPWSYLLISLALVFPFFYSGYRGRTVTKLPLSGISFWVYLLHFPTALSLGLGILLFCPGSFWLRFGLAMAAVVGAVLAASAVLSKTFDVWTGRLVKWVKSRLLG